VLLSSSSVREKSSLIIHRKKKSKLQQQPPGTGPQVLQTKQPNMIVHALVIGWVRAITLLAGVRNQNQRVKNEDKIYSFDNVT